MAETTAIEWADATWSPWEGCTKVSPGCDHCYAASMNGWLKRGANWGPGAPRLEYSEAHWEKPLRWNAKAFREKRRLRVFPSVCDPFDNEVAPELRAKFFDLIAATPYLTWLLLTKRIGNAANMLPLPFDFDRHYPNAWIGATVVNREEMLRDGPKLKAVGAAVTFWSVEPMLGGLGNIPHDLLPDWVICGGESGRGARPMHPEWAASLRNQCETAGVPFMFKQWGEWRPLLNMTRDEQVHHQGTDWLWLKLNGTTHRNDDVTPYDASDAAMKRIGKKEAGRLLDWREHNAFPRGAE